MKEQLKYRLTPVKNIPTPKIRYVLIPTIEKPDIMKGDILENKYIKQIGYKADYIKRIMEKKV
jgi:hypothetical protein